jgi:signal transduction histidine kinase
VTDPTTRRVSWGLWIAGLVVFLATETFRFVSHEPFHANDFSEPFAFASIGVVGLIVALHQPRNAIGWIYLTVWIGAAGIFAGMQEYAYWAETSHPDAPGGSVATWFVNWAWVPIFVLLLTYPFMLFPDGHLPSRRWRPVAWAIAIAGALWSVTFALDNTSDYTDALNHPILNPYAPAPPTPLLDGARLIVSFVLLGLMAATIVSLVLRYRSAKGDQREQIRWLLFAGAVTLVWFALPVNHGVGGWVDFVQGMVLTLIPISVGVAILKYRLYDIDVVISRTVVYVTLAAFITLVYVAVVVVLGGLIGAADDSLGLSIVATAIVAVAFQPVRQRVQRVANRFVYGERATPYEVLSRFSDRVAGTYATEDVLPRTARVIAEGTGAERAEVWLRIGDELVVGGAWPTNGEDRRAVPLDAEGAFLLAGADRTVPVRYHDELLGAIAVAKPSGQVLSPAEDKLLTDLSSQAGVVLSNVRLTADLEVRLDQIARQAAELRASRQRIVAAQDAERRRLERNIHDGAQQHLVALAVKLRLTRGLVRTDPGHARAMLEELRGEIGLALDTLNALSLGIYPPLLEEQGIAPALAAQYLRTSLPVRLDAKGLRRYPIETEAAVYFCCLEALQNAAKYSHASAITIVLRHEADAVGFTVADDGVGFTTEADGSGTGMQGMRDRIAVLGGDVSIESSPGVGTTVRGRVPVAERMAW